uniref:ANK_REP_REGION domain-containing protein n=1 Tax=Macrostomum lignano TaxID=282301 RepID=A0A1I8FNC4_9PLAT
MAESGKSSPRDCTCSCSLKCSKATAWVGLWTAERRCTRRPFNGNVPMMQVLLDHGALGGTCGTPEASARCTWPATRATAKRFTCCSTRAANRICRACGGLSPLHLACQAGHYEIVKTLAMQQLGPDAAHRGRPHRFDVACEFGRFSIAQLLLSLKSVSCLLHKDIGRRGSEARRSPASIWPPRMATLLLGQQGANPNRMTEHGTCLHLAAIHGQLEAVKFLLEVS